MISAPLESAVVSLAHAMTVRFVGLPNNPLAWIFVDPLNEKPLLDIVETQEAVPVTVPVCPFPEESAADVPLDSLSFQWAMRLCPSAGAAGARLSNPKIGVSSFSDLTANCIERRPM